ncbi:MAG: PEPxxWA-CTERM sorting domain-containing protein [Phenylobacterium sp.]|nr:PEPxxWA-CTERM sorting domain-containing protein [Phenylobacterium sp.]
MKTRLLATLSAAAALAAFAPAQAVTVIDFEGDVVGTVTEGFISSGFPELVFYSDLGAGLEIGDFGEQSDGKALAARPDANGNFIRGEFTDGAHSMLSMTFGNDDPFFTNPGDRAVLTVFLGGALVGQTFVILNRNDTMDQTIGFNFGPFDSFTFAYTNPAGAPFTGGGGVSVGLIEMIDNITFDTLAAVIPEPSAWGMMILGFGGVGGILRRRRDSLAPEGA